MFICYITVHDEKFFLSSNEISDWIINENKLLEIKTDCENEYKVQGKIKSFQNTVQHLYPSSVGTDLVL